MLTLRKRLPLYVAISFITMLMLTAVAWAYDNLPEQSGDLGAWFQALVDMIKNHADLGWRGLTAGSIVLLIGISKFTFVKPYWDKLGAWKFAIPLALGAIGELILNFPVPFQWGTFISVIITGVAGSGALSIAIHHIMDKLLPSK